MASAIAAGSAMRVMWRTVGVDGGTGAAVADDLPEALEEEEIAAICPWRERIWSSWPDDWLLKATPMTMNTSVTEAKSPANLASETPRLPPPRNLLCFVPLPVVLVNLFDLCKPLGPTRQISGQPDSQK